MSTTSQKHREFVSEPMGSKAVTELPGVGVKLGRRLTNKGVDKASTVLGQYLALNRNEEKFEKWMKDNCGANKKQARDCYNGVREWEKQFI